MNNQQLTIVLINNISELEKLSAAVEAFGAQLTLPPALVFKFNLVLDELVTNVISYAFPPNERHEFSLRLWQEEDWLRAELRDQGRPFNPLEFPSPDTNASLEDRSIGGLGVHLLKEMMDTCAYQRDEGWNCLSFGKKLS